MEVDEVKELERELEEEEGRLGVELLLPYNSCPPTFQLFCFNCQKLFQSKLHPVPGVETVMS
jgi:hypothetical protein